MAVESPPWALSAGSYTAEQTRRAAFAWAARTASNSPGIVSGGLLSASDLQLSAPGSGMSVLVSTGECLIGGSEGAAQGAAYARATSQTSLSIAAASPSNPRVDLVCATMSDTGYTEPTGGSGSQWALQVISGTPTATASLSNLLGVGTLPLSSLLLGYCLIPTSSTNVTTANISNVATSVAFQGLSGAPVRGAVNIATSQSTSSTTYTALTTPDQVVGVVMPTNGLIAVWYQAVWQESVLGASRAAIFIGVNQLQIAGGPGTEAAAQAAPSVINRNSSLSSTSFGLVSLVNSYGVYGGDVTTGQALGVDGTTFNVGSTHEQNGAVYTSGASPAVGGPCHIFATAGTYTISVQFKASSGSVTASNRKLWVQALSFS